MSLDIKSIATISCDHKGCQQTIDIEATPVIKSYDPDDGGDEIDYEYNIPKNWMVIYSGRRYVRTKYFCLLHHNPNNNK